MERHGRWPSRSEVGTRQLGSACVPFAAPGPLGCRPRDRCLARSRRAWRVGRNAHLGRDLPWRARATHDGRLRLRIGRRPRCRRPESARRALRGECGALADFRPHRCGGRSRRGARPPCHRMRRHGGARRATHLRRRVAHPGPLSPERARAIATRRSRRDPNRCRARGPLIRRKLDARGLRGGDGATVSIRHRPARRRLARLGLVARGAKVALATGDGSGPRRGVGDGGPRPSLRRPERCRRRLGVAPSLERILRSRGRTAKRAAGRIRSPTRCARQTPSPGCMARAAIANALGVARCHESTRAYLGSMAERGAPSRRSILARSGARSHAPGDMERERGARDEGERGVGRGRGHSRRRGQRHARRHDRRCLRIRPFRTKRVLAMARPRVMASAGCGMPRVAHLATSRPARKLAARAGIGGGRRRRRRCRRCILSPQLVARHRDPARPGHLRHDRAGSRGHTRPTGRHSLGSELVAGACLGTLRLSPPRDRSRASGDRDPLRHPFGQTSFGVMVVGARPPRTRPARALWAPRGLPARASFPP